MTLDTLQTRFVDEVLHGTTHVVLTGKAGTGKSTALCAAVSAAKADGMDVLVMAPTAMAASIHRDNGLESGTIHHALRWNPVREPLPRKFLSLCGAYMCWGIAPDQNRVLFIDECSMVGLWLFEILGRDLGDPKRPFDGRRVVLVGDWAQLPPVVGPEEATMAAAMPELSRFGPADGCVLHHPMFRLRPPVSVVLEETHRANSEWFAALNRVRECPGRASLAALGITPRSDVHFAVDASVHMCFRRDTAHARNTEKLSRLSGKVHHLRLRDGVIGLPEGCDVIVTSNRAAEGYINGSRAVFRGVNGAGEAVLDDGQSVKMLADGNWGSSYDGGHWELDEDAALSGVRQAASFLRMFSKLLEPDAVKWLEELGKPANVYRAAAFGSGRIVMQPYFPILPGYALTVHKAQGMTLPGVVLEADVFFNNAPPRLPYVALSRVSDGSRVSLAGIDAYSAYVRPDWDYAGVMARIKAWSK